MRGKFECKQKNIYTVKKVYWMTVDHLLGRIGFKIMLPINKRKSYTRGTEVCELSNSFALYIIIV